jgi:hypothetical protein
MHGRTGREQEPYPQTDILRAAAAAARAVDAGSIARRAADPALIPAAVEAARLQAVTDALETVRQRGHGTGR